MPGSRQGDLFFSRNVTSAKKRKENRNSLIDVGEDGRRPGPGQLSRAAFTIGATWCRRGQDEVARVGTPTHPLPSKGKVAPSIAGCLGQLDSQAAHGSWVELVVCCCLAHWGLPYLLGVSRGGGEAVQRAIRPGRGNRGPNLALHVSWECAPHG